MNGEWRPSAAAGPRSGLQKDPGDDGGQRRAEAIDLLLAAVLGSAAFGLYFLTLAPTVLPGDPGEFQFAPPLLGLAHPTGYPLYSLLGWAWSHLLPVGDVAYRMNLFSAFWGALAVALAYATARLVVRQAAPELSPAVRRLAALLAAATFAVTPSFWSQAVIAEVYTLHVFFVVALLYLILAWGEQRRPAYLYLAAGCFGLSLAHHRTTLVLVPALLAYLWFVDGRRVGRGTGRRRGLKILALVALPQLLYLTIPLRAPHTPYLTQALGPGQELVLYENTLPGFLSFVLGGPFGGSVDLSVNLLERLKMAGGLLRAEVGWPGIILALAGLTWLAGRAWGQTPSKGASPAHANTPRRSRYALLALTVLSYLGTIAFNLVYTIGDIFVLFIPSYLVLVLWLAIGVAALARAIGRVVPRAWAAPAHALPPFVLVLPLLALPLWSGAARYSALDHSHRTEVRAGWEAILAEPLPAGAVLITNDRNDIMPLWYLQYIEHRRPDLTSLFPLITADVPTLGHVLDLAWETGRPVYLIKDMPGIDVKVQTAREGRLWRVTGLSAGIPPANSSDVRLEEAVALVGYDLVPPDARSGEPLHVRLTWQALRPLDLEYHSFVHLLDAAGQAIAQSDRQPGGVYYPTTLWRPGEQLRDDHVLDIPAATPPGAYRLLVGLYTLPAEPGGELQHLGEPMVIGQVVVQ